MLFLLKRNGKNFTKVVPFEKEQQKITNVVPFEKEQQKLRNVVPFEKEQQKHANAIRFRNGRKIEIYVCTTSLKKKIMYKL